MDKTPLFARNGPRMHSLPAIWLKAGNRRIYAFNHFGGKWSRNIRNACLPQTHPSFVVRTASVHPSLTEAATSRPRLLRSQGAPKYTHPKHILYTSPVEVEIVAPSAPHPGAKRGGHAAVGCSGAEGLRSKLILQSDYTFDHCAKNSSRNFRLPNPGHPSLVVHSSFTHPSLVPG